MITLSNGLVEVDGAYDAPVFDRASAEPAVQIDQDGYKIVAQPTENAIIAASPTITEVIIDLCIQVWVT